MNGPLWLYLLIGYAPLALLVFAPICAMQARRRNRDSETWLLLGGAFGPLAMAWIALLPARSRRNDADRAEHGRRRTPAHRIPTTTARLGVICPLCGRPQMAGHLCSPEAVEDRVQGRWTVRIGGQRIIGPL